MVHTLCKYSLTISYTNNLNKNMTLKPVDDVTTSQTLQFYDAAEDWIMARETDYDETFNQAKATDTSLEHFFRRP